MCRWLTSKEIDSRDIPQQRLQCIELLYLMEKELPTSFFDIQVHVLIHLVDEIELAQSCEHTMDVLGGEVHGSFEGICASEGKTKRIDGRGMVAS